MASKNVSSLVGHLYLSSSIIRSDDASLVGPWTCSKFKVAATIVDRICDDQTRTQTVIILGARKDESSESKKLTSISEDFVSNEISHEKSQYVSDADSITGSPSKSPEKEQKKLDFALFEASRPMDDSMNLLATGVILMQ
ncbi:hypothetical protein ACH5RR_012806 [Cinchona calisaya]|uniref:Uncharacterized protein n=1 Tax=Cinchona calisaya TaxID=153742 RepID=A0ABD3ACF6_9GENT